MKIGYKFAEKKDLQDENLHVPSVLHEEGIVVVFYTNFAEIEFILFTSQISPSFEIKVH